MIVESIRGEYRRYRDIADKALAQTSDEAYWHVPGEMDNSIAIIVHHLTGNLLSRFTDFLTTDGEKTWRNRDGEFETPAHSRAEMIERWNQAWQVLYGALDGVDDDMLGNEVTIRQQPHTIVAALHRSLAHTAYHVGQIVYLARQARGSDWQTMSIPRGGSAAYNQNPTRETMPS